MKQPPNQLLLEGYTVCAVEAWRIYIESERANQAVGRVRAYTDRKRRTRDPPS